MQKAEEWDHWDFVSPLCRFLDSEDPKEISLFISRISLVFWQFESQENKILSANKVDSVYEIAAKLSVSVYRNDFSPLDLIILRLVLDSFRGILFDEINFNGQLFSTVMQQYIKKARKKFLSFGLNLSEKVETQFKKYLEKTLSSFVHRLSKFSYFLTLLLASHTFRDIDYLEMSPEELEKIKAKLKKGLESIGQDRCFRRAMNIYFVSMLQIKTTEVIRASSRRPRSQSERVRRMSGILSPRYSVNNQANGKGIHVPAIDLDGVAASGVEESLSARQGRPRSGSKPVSLFKHTVLSPGLLRRSLRNKDASPSSLSKDRPSPWSSTKPKSSSCLIGSILNPTYHSNASIPEQKSMSSLPSSASSQSEKCAESSSRFDGLKA